MSTPMEESRKRSDQWGSKVPADQINKRKTTSPPDDRNRIETGDEDPRSEKLATLEGSVQIRRVGEIGGLREKLAATRKGGHRLTKVGRIR